MVEYNGSRDAIILKSGKTLLTEELEEIREIILHQCDEEDIRNVANSGIFNDTILFDAIPDSCISEIAKEKAVYERQRGYSWGDAANEAIVDWAKQQRTRLINLLPRRPDGTLDSDIVNKVLGPLDYAIWCVVVPS